LNPPSERGGSGAVSLAPQDFQRIEIIYIIRTLDFAKIFVALYSIDIIIISQPAKIYNFPV
jgi:hypothetical protein